MAARPPGRTAKSGAGLAELDMNWIVPRRHDVLNGKTLLDARERSCTLMCRCVYQLACGSAKPEPIGPAAGDRTGAHEAATRSDRTGEVESAVVASSRSG